MTEDPYAWWPHWPQDPAPKATTDRAILEAEEMAKACPLRKGSK